MFMDTVIVIMQKNKKTGLFEKELNSLNISQYEDYILNIYVEADEDKERLLKIKLTTNRDVLDWEYSAIYDYYELEIFENLGYDIKEFEDYNPTWEITLKYLEDEQELIKTIDNILYIHMKELEEVFKTIKDKKGEYLDEE